MAGRKKGPINLDGFIKDAKSTLFPVILKDRDQHLVIEVSPLGVVTNVVETMPPKINYNRPGMPNAELEKELRIEEWKLMMDPANAELQALAELPDNSQN